MTGSSTSPAATPLDSTWLRAHPLPDPGEHADKNARGRVLVVGGSRTVPGGVRLTAKAAFRSGAGKVQVATIESAALPLGVAVPEIAVFGLPETDDGEIAQHCAAALVPLLPRCDAAILGPAMGCRDAGGAVVDTLLAESVSDGACEAALVIDAASLISLPSRAQRLRERASPAILTPHIGEMAALLECDADGIEDDRAAATLRAAERYGAIVVLKGSTSLVATPDGELFAYAGGGVGLATGGSGDVLAGIVAGLAARGASPLEATLWAVWLHGEAGRRCAEQLGPLGFLASELLAHVPGLMRGV